LIIGNTFAIDQLKSIVKFGNMPNLILSVSFRFDEKGPSGNRQDDQLHVHGALNA